MTLRVDCSRCGHVFQVPKSMKGGLANCPDCRQAVPVAGGPEALFWFLVALAALAVTGLTILLASLYGWQVGVIAATVGVVGIAVFIACQ